MHMHTTPEVEMDITTLDTAQDQEIQTTLIDLETQTTADPETQIIAEEDKATLTVEEYLQMLAIEVEVDLTQTTGREHIALVQDHQTIITQDLLRLEPIRDHTLQDLALRQEVDHTTLLLVLLEVGVQDTQEAVLLEVAVIHVLEEVDLLQEVVVAEVEEEDK